MSRTCDIDNCEAQTQARGMCDKHYRRWLKTGTTDPKPTICTVEGCEQKIRCRAMCDMHYRRLKRTGTTDPGPGRGTALARWREKQKEAKQ